VNPETTLRRLADDAAIRDLARRYAHCVWQRDAAGAADLFAPDGEMNTGDRPVIRGRDAVRTAYEEIFTTSELYPMVHNHVIELDDDRASGTCYLDLRARVDGEDRVGSGFYQDQYVRLDGAWKFASRKLTMCYFVAADAPPAS